MPEVIKLVQAALAGLATAVMSLFVQATPAPMILSVTDAANLTPLPTQIATPAPLSTPPPTAAATALGQTVQSALVGTRGSYGIVVKNLKTGETYESNEHQSYKSGSLYKLWVMADAYKQIENGSLSEGDTMSRDIVYLNQKFGIDPDEAEQTSGTETLTVEDALTQMITVSDNYAALLLTDKLGAQNISDFLSKNGFAESNLGDIDDAPTTTASDIALFYKKLYQGSLAGSDTTNKMTNLLKQQVLNDGIPKYLPGEVDVAHKTGEIDDTAHDAGIVYAPGGDYIIVVLSQSDDTAQATERIADVSQAVYNYFSK